jgi:hypothetical protein
MAHFYGTLQGCRGEATRCGSKDSGMSTYCASWEGAVHCEAFIDPDTGMDWVTVTLTPWQGRGTSKLLYSGPISGNPSSNPAT